MAFQCHACSDWIDAFASRGFTATSYLGQVFGSLGHGARTPAHGTDAALARGGRRKPARLCVISPDEAEPVREQDEEEDEQRHAQPVVVGEHAGNGLPRKAPDAQQADEAQPLDDTDVHGVAGAALAAAEALISCLNCLRAQLP